MMPVLRGVASGCSLHFFSLLISMDMHAIFDGFVVCLTTFHSSVSYQRVVSCEIFMAVAMKMIRRSLANFTNVSEERISLVFRVKLEVEQASTEHPACCLLGFLLTRSLCLSL